MPIKATGIDYRAKLVDLMTRTLSDESVNHDWIYHAVRPMYVPSSWKPGQKVTGDCSKGVQYLCRWAGLPHDPMNWGWGPLGNSSTLCARLPHAASASQLVPGDIVTFGPYGDEHAAMVLKAGTDPTLWSFGHQGAPNSYNLSWDTREKQFLKLIVPTYVPTGDALLRTMTGYWSWLQWLLGEGDWAGKGKKNSKIRPNVPARIPLDWWKAATIFIANRNKANTKPS